MAPHIVLRELGRPFELSHVDKDANGHRSPEYLQLNPNGLIPVLEHDGLVLFESAAISMHLADLAAGGSLAPLPGESLRAQYTQWLFWLSSTLQPALHACFYSERYVETGNVSAAEEVRRIAQQRVSRLVDLLDDHFAETGGPWTLGERYSAVDAHAFMLCRWTRTFDEPARLRPHLRRFLDAMLDRPAVRRVIDTEGLTPPLV